jgi:hypothetical protein
MWRCINRESRYNIGFGGQSMELPTSSRVVLECERLQVRKSDRNLYLGYNIFQCDVKNVTSGTGGATILLP